MKSKTITAIIMAAALVIFSAALFFNSKQKKQQAFSLTGKWELDTLYATQPINDSIQRLISGMLDPRAKETYSFNTDSSFNRLSSKDSTTEKYYLKENILYFNEGNEYIPYPVKTITDSLFSFINKDSVVFVLKKI